jgi:hypothetical protein
MENELVILTGTLTRTSRAHEQSVVHELIHSSTGSGETAVRGVEKNSRMAGEQARKFRLGTFSSDLAS